MNNDGNHNTDQPLMKRSVRGRVGAVISASDVPPPPPDAAMLQDNLN